MEAADHKVEEKLDQLSSISKEDNVAPKSEPLHNSDGDNETNDLDILKCDQCDRVFHTMRSLQCHIKIHNEKVLKCCFCDHRFNRTDALITHVIEHRLCNGKPLECPAAGCKDVVATIVEGERHVYRCHLENGSPMLKCPDCEEAAPNFRKLYTHRLTKHGELKEFAENAMREQKQYLQKKKNLTRRAKKRGMTEDYVEQKRSAISVNTTPEESETAVKAEYDEEEEDDDEEEDAPAENSENEKMALDLMASIKQAVTAEEGETPSQMLEKLSTFVRKVFPINGNEEYYKCDHCSLKFEDAILWMVHLGFHDVEDPFKCGGCGRKYENRQAFVIHLTYFAHGSKSQQEME